MTGISLYNLTRKGSPVAGTFRPRSAHTAKEYQIFLDSHPKDPAGYLSINDAHPKQEKQDLAGEKSDSLKQNEPWLKVDMLFNYTKEDELLGVRSEVWKDNEIDGIGKALLEFPVGRSLNKQYPYQARLYLKSLPKVISFYKHFGFKPHPDWDKEASDEEGQWMYLPLDGQIYWKARIPTQPCLSHEPEFLKQLWGEVAEAELECPSLPAPVQDLISDYCSGPPLPEASA